MAVIFSDENDSREHNGEEEDKMEVDEDAALKWDAFDYKLPRLHSSVW